MARTTYLFVFGRTPRLSFLELQSFFPIAALRIPEVAAVISDSDLPADQIIDRMGGTVKIAREVGHMKVLDSSLTHFIDTATSITFGVSAYGGATIPKGLLKDIKETLESKGFSARYVAPKDDVPLSSVTVDKRHVQELVVFKDEDGFVIGKTVAVQDVDKWSARDRGRPHADAKSGMLPVKIARTLVNIAVTDPYGVPDQRQRTVYDPFCGMGTIVAEAYLAGCRVYGSDISGDVIARASENIRWLKARYPDGRGAVVDMFLGDAVHAGDVLPAQSVHAIVTEPYMGTTQIALRKAVDVSRVRNQIKGLEKLYIGCLRNWLGILAAGGKVVIALPSYTVQGRTYTVKKTVDMCENLGYTIVDGPIEYSRPGAVVKRQFYILKKK